MMFWVDVFLMFFFQQVFVFFCIIFSNGFGQRRESFFFVECQWVESSFKFMVFLLGSGWFIGSFFSVEFFGIRKDFLVLFCFLLLEFQVFFYSYELFLVELLDFLVFFSSQVFLGFGIVLVGSGFLFEEDLGVLLVNFYGVLLIFSILLIVIGVVDNGFLFYNFFMVVFGYSSYYSLGLQGQGVILFGQLFFF